MDYYDILGASRSDTIDEIKKRYQERAKQLHPDKNKDDPRAIDKFSILSKAYEVLSDPIKKMRYDTYGLKNYEKSVNDDYSDEYTDTEDDDDYYEMEKIPDRANIYIKLNMRLEDIYRGCTKKITIERFNDCIVEPLKFEHPDYGPTIKYCYVGRDPEDTEVTLTLTPTDPKQKHDERGFIHFENMGHALPPDMQKRYGVERGTMFIMPASDNKLFKLGYNPFGPEDKPENLLKVVRLSAIEGLLGFKRRVDHPMGKFLVITDWGVPVENNTLKAFKGYGMPIYGTKKYGTLYIRFKVEPLKLKAKQKKEIRKILTGKEEFDTSDVDATYKEDVQVHVKITKDTVPREEIKNECLEDDKNLIDELPCCIQ